MTAYVEFVAILGFVGLIAWCLLDDIGTWFNSGYDRIAVCAGCQRHRLIPGCPVHDPQERRTPVAENTEAVQTTREKGSSFVAS